MASFNGNDYDRLFDLGREIYLNRRGNSRLGEIGVELMAMAESVRGQMTPWPNLNKRYRGFTTYPRQSATVRQPATVLKLVK
jgi:hypothetical protein